jgi:opacity protein-like surface antigen
MVVAGDYTATNNTNFAQTIFSGGSLQILDDGIVRFGNQSTGTGNSDLTVLPGGTLEINGGVLEIDDQLNIGGGVYMTGGYVFAHKYGAGSSITSVSGPFVVSAGASGNISGGIIRVCGKDGGSWPGIALNDPDFDFSGSSTLLITNGVSTARSDVTIKTVIGTELQNLLISKPGYIVNLASDIVINGQAAVMEESSLRVMDGNSVQVK